MPALVITPNLELMKVEQIGFWAVSASIATVRCACAIDHSVPCSGFRVEDIPLDGHLVLIHELGRAGKEFIRKMARRGYDWCGEMRVHGPRVSYEFGHTASDIGSAVWGEAKRPDGNGDQHPEKVLSFVFNRQTVNDLYEYLFAAEFLKRAVLTEVIVKES